MFVEVTEEKLVGGPFCSLPILNRVKVKNLHYMEIKTEMYLNKVFEIADKFHHLCTHINKIQIFLLFETLLK